MKLSYYQTIHGHKKALNNSPILPKDLKTVEELLVNSIYSVLSKQEIYRFSISLKFEGIKLQSIISRIVPYLDKYNLTIATSDEGSKALMKRDNPLISSLFYSMKDIINQPNIINNSDLLITISPQPYDYDLFEKLSQICLIPHCIINPKLEDTAIGLGNISRTTRKDFVNSWIPSFWLQPLTNAALMKVYPDKWHLFNYTQTGYIFLRSFDSKPTLEDIEALI